MWRHIRRNLYDMLYDKHNEKYFATVLTHQSILNGGAPGLKPKQLDTYRMLLFSVVAFFLAVVHAVNL